MKNLVSTLRSPASLELGAPRTAAGDLKDMASGTRGIALIAAARRSRGQDPEGGSGRSSLHLPEEVALSSRDPSPADSRWPHAGPGRDLSVERKARRKRSPRLPCVQLVGGHGQVSGRRGPGRQQGGRLDPQGCGGRGLGARREERDRACMPPSLPSACCLAVTP